jgi:hypothetical protein
MTDKTEVVATAVMSALAVGSFLVFGKSVIDHAFTIGNGEFRCSIEINCAHHSAGIYAPEGKPGYDGKLWNVPALWVGDSSPNFEAAKPIFARIRFLFQIRKSILQYRHE